MCQCVFRTVLKLMHLNNKVQKLRKYRPYLGNFLVISVTMAHNIQRLSKRFQQLLRALVRFAEQRHRVGLCWIGHSKGGPSSLFTPSLSPVNEADVFLYQMDFSLPILRIQELKSVKESRCIDCQSKYFAVLIFLQQTPGKVRSLVIFTHVLF